MSLNVNGFPINVTVFPDKTSQVWKLDEKLFKKIEEDEAINITWKFEGEHELMHLHQAVALIEEIMGCYKLNLSIPYMPYGRQDKDISNESCFALNIFLQMLYQMDVDSITTFDVHNPEPFEEIKEWIDFTNILPEKEIKDISKKHDVKTIVFPDMGANNRYKNLIPMDISILYGQKTRNQLTGEITGLTLSEEEIYLYVNQQVLVIDDICDGGRTFIELAKKIVPYNPRELILYVSHGIFSKGIDILKDAGYTSIYTKEGKVL